MVVRFRTKCTGRSYSFVVKRRNRAARRKFAEYLGVLRLPGAGTPSLSLSCPPDMSKYLEKNKKQNNR